MRHLSTPTQPARAWRLELEWELELPNSLVVFKVQLHSGGKKGAAARLKGDRAIARWVAMPAVAGMYGCPPPNTWSTTALLSRRFA